MILRSLLAKLLGVSLAVAAVSVLATAWLTTSSTERELSSMAERLLETDTSIFGSLAAHGSSHDDWDDVGPLISDLSSETGRRIALTTVDGELIADSALLESDDRPLPDRPAALIDPYNPSILVNQGVEDFESEVLGVGPVYNLTAEELEERVTIADEAAECLDLLGVGYDRPTATEIYPEFVDDVVLDQVAGLCIDERLYAPGAAELEANTEDAERVASCLEDSGVTYTTIDDVYGPLIEVDFEDERATTAYSSCTDTSYRVRLEPFIAEPVLLYLGEADGGGLGLPSVASTRTLLTAAAVLAAAALVTVLAARRILHPVSALTMAARRLGRGDLTSRVDVGRGDEVGELGRAFNAMADSLSGQEELRRRMVSDVAHELRTPLANIRGYLEAVQDGVTPLDRPLVDSLHEEALLLQRLVGDLQTLALAEAGQLHMHRQRVDIGEVAATTAAAHDSLAAEAGVRLMTERDGGVLDVDADPERLRQAIGNLVINAIRYTPAGGSVTVRSRREGTTAVVDVEDTGIGIEADHLPHVFDRFWRADSSRTRDTGGSGLGLSICKQLVEAHGGSVSVRSRMGGGSVFTIVLPAAERRTRDRSREPNPPVSVISSSRER